MPPDDQTVAKMESNKEEGQRAGFTVRQVVAKTRKVSGEIWDGREREAGRVSYQAPEMTSREAQRSSGTLTQ